jgi:hypothetical protein
MTEPAKPNYTDEEIYVLAELQFGKPPVTSRNSLQVGQGQDLRAGKYYNELTDLLFRVVDHDLLRMRALRTGFYARHNIMAFDTDSYVEWDPTGKKGGPFDNKGFKR